MTTSADLIEALTRGFDPGRFLIILGYAGWGPGQLEHEMQENSWVFAEVDNDIIFQTEASGRWDAAAKLAGIDLTRMSFYSGKA
jgi:putative transcriptional regulator